MFAITHSIDTNKITAATFLHNVKLAELNIQAFPVFEPRPSRGVEPGALKEAVRQVLEAGKDPYADKTIQKLVAQAQIAPVMYQIDQEDEITHSIDALKHYRDETPALIQTIEKEFIQDVEFLEAAQQRLGRVDIVNALNEIKSAGNDRGELIFKAHMTNRKLTRYLEVFPYFLSVIGEEVRNPGPFLYSAPTGEQWTDYGLGEAFIGAKESQHPWTPWDVLHRGIEVSLATSAETVEARRAKVQAHIDRVDA
ncbi:hypothetical protein [Neomicrococcus lactis]|uniref:hypothetical protein n=1 Tax=Neomicrococcus lactis TaxID=732241 RepID=UPI0023005667|nr:hypothetical protein [Neomicrococcus lactis]